MADDGLLFMCVGCCCGRQGHGGELAPARHLKSVVRRAFDASGLSGRVRLSFTECLGPCSESNVVFLYLHGHPLWLRRVNTGTLFAGVLAYADRASRDPSSALPASLEGHAFTWTGGGIGPKPPVPDGGPS